MIRTLSVATTVLIFSLSAATTMADVVVLNPSKDNTIFEPESEKSNGAGDYIFAGHTDGGDKRRALIAFDIAGNIPAGSVINSATLTLRMSRTKAGTVNVTLHLLAADWGEGTSIAGGTGGGDPASATDDDATWEYRLYDQNNPSSSSASTDTDLTTTKSTEHTPSIARMHL